MLQRMLSRGLAAAGVQRRLTSVGRRSTVMFSTFQDNLQAEMKAEMEGLVAEAKKDLGSMKRQRAELTKEIKQVERFLATEEIGLDLEALKNEMAGAADIDSDEFDPAEDEGYGIDRSQYLEILPIGHSVLSKTAALVPEEMFGSEELKTLITRMLYTLGVHEGVGIAAPQVGESLSVMIVQQDEVDRTPRPDRVLPDQYADLMQETDYPTEFPRRILCNPVITVAEGSYETCFFEACLSVEGYFGIVPRHSKIHVEAVDPHGNPVRFTAQGWEARVIQHEVDHLNGVLYVDRMVPNSFAADEAFMIEYWHSEDGDDEDDGLGGQEGPHFSLGGDAVELGKR